MSEIAIFQQLGSLYLGKPQGTHRRPKLIGGGDHLKKNLLLHLGHLKLWNLMPARCVKRHPTKRRDESGRRRVKQANGHHRNHETSITDR